MGVSQRSQSASSAYRQFSQYQRSSKLKLLSGCMWGDSTNQISTTTNRHRIRLCWNG